MSNWLSNGSCPNCGSKDNLATYSDGHKWCWGCHYYEPGDRLYAVKTLSQPVQDVKTRSVVLPYDVDVNYPQRALDWITQYDLNRSDLLKNRVLWSESTGLLIFPYFGSTEGITAWQGRNFGKKYSTKWYGRGNLESVVTFLPRNTERIKRVIFVEDIVSAIKVGKVLQPDAACQPIFGSNISKKRLAACSAVAKDLEFIYWLDRDKAKEAITFSTNARSLGFKSSVIITDLDPKCIDYPFIKEKLYGISCEKTNY